MLSHDLQSLSGWVKDLLVGNTIPTREGFQTFSNALDDAVKNAQSLESTCVAQAVRLTTSQLGGNIIAFPRLNQPKADVEHAG